MTESQKNQAALKIAASVCEAVDAAGSMGTPGGTIYAALMAHGCSLSQYESLMGQLEAVGAVTRTGELYRCTDKGRAIVRAVG